MLTRTLSNTRRSGRRRLGVGVLLALGGLGVSGAPAAAIVVEGMNSMPLPLGVEGHIGSWNGSSGVPVGPHWLITAKHTGGFVPLFFIMNGHWHTAVEIRDHPTLDLRMVRVAEAFPGWHRIATGVGNGDPCVLGGWGVTAGAPLPGGNGYTWGGPHGETWGANRVYSSSTAMLGVRFDAPGTGDAVPYEAMFAVNDSGGGLFTWGVDGQLELAAIAVSVSGFGQATYGQMGYAIRLEPVRDWIMAVADPSLPMLSSVIAPRESSLGAGWTLAASAALLAGVAGLRRRTR